MERSFTEYLRKTISIRDTFVKKTMKENFCHGILLRILGYKDNWSVSSDKESGDGKLENGCRAALKQIENNRYEEMLQDEGIDHILKYGIACYKKRCRVMLAENVD